MSGKLTVALLTLVPDMFLGFPDDGGHSLAANRYQEGRARPAAPRAPHGLEDLNQSYDIELTYTSNAIEGNTLTAAETRTVIEHGVTIGGKPLKDHLEALDHFEALRYVRDLARQAVPLREPNAAGRYANEARFVETDSGRHHFPSPSEVPAPMGDFAQWLGGAAATPETAFAAHRRLAEIHPFNDGNGRTARLLMNLVLLRGDYPPVAVRPEDRPAYIDTLQDTLLYERWTQRWRSV